MSGMVKLYHPSGVEVLLPIDEAIQAATTQINEYVQMGYRIDPPEHHEQVQIGWVCRRSRIDEKRGNEIPILDCYVDHPQMVNKYITVYINTEQQQHDFESMSGIALSALPFWIGKQAPERGENRETDKLIIRLPHPVLLSWKPNPKYDPNPDIPAKDRKPKRLFVNWVGRGNAREISENNVPDASISFQWNARAVKQLLAEAEAQGWSTESVKLALGLQKSWDELNGRFLTYDDAWRTIVDYLSNQVTDLTF